MQKTDLRQRDQRGATIAPPARANASPRPNPAVGIAPLPDFEELTEAEEVILEDTLALPEEVVATAAELVRAPLLPLEDDALVLPSEVVAAVALPVIVPAPWVPEGV